MSLSFFPVSPSLLGVHGIATRALIYPQYHRAVVVLDPVEQLMISCRPPVHRVTVFRTHAAWAETLTPRSCSLRGASFIHPFVALGSDPSDHFDLCGSCSIFTKHKVPERPKKCFLTVSARQVHRTSARQDAVRLSHRASQVKGREQTTKPRIPSSTPSFFLGVDCCSSPPCRCHS